MVDEQEHESGRVCVIGSHVRSLVRFSILLFGVFAMLAILYLVIDHYLKNGLLACFLLLGGIIIALFEALVFRRLPRWIAFAMKDSADGVVDDSGLRYRSFFKWHSVGWSKISRIEYYPRHNGRMNVYLINRLSPIRFGPTGSAEFGGRDCLSKETAIQLMQDRLSESGTGSTFTIVDRKE